MGLQKYKRTRWHDDDALLFSSGWMRLYRGKIFARWVYRNTNARDDMTTMRCFFLLDGCVCIGVKYLQDGFTKLQTHAMTWRRRCVAFLLDGCVCIFVKYLQDGFTEIQMTWRRCVAFSSGWMRLYLSKIFARWVYKDTNARDDMTTMRCTESPIYFVHASSKPRFLTKMRHQKSGIPCSV